jgi:hypothetical protein
MPTSATPSSRVLVDLAGVVVAASVLRVTVSLRRRIACPI